MTILIDGYNMIFSAEEFSDLMDESSSEAARNMLLRILARYHSIAGVELIVFFDGGEEGRGLPRKQKAFGITVIFSDPDVSADHDIKRMVSRSSDPRNLRVVSSDRDIWRFAEKHGASTVKSREFLREVRDKLRKADAKGLDEPISKYQGPSESEVIFWQHVFKDIEED